MTNYIKLGPAVAILAAAGFAGATGYVLFEDVLWHSAPFTTKHVMTLAVLIGAAYFGDRITWNWQRKRHITAAGCALLAFVGSAFCVFLSSGRTASVTITKNADIRKANGDRSKLEADEKAAREDRAAKTAERKRATEAREDAQRRLSACQATPRKPECRGVSRVLEQARRIETEADVRAERADTAYFQAAGKLQATPALQVENADLKASGALFSTLGMGSPEAIEALLAMVVPFAQSLFCEIAFLVAVSNVRSYLGHGSVPAETKGTTETDPPTRRRKQRQSPSTEKLNGSNVIRLPVEAKAKAETLAFVLAKLGAGHSFPSQDALAARAGVVKSTISKWCAEWEAAGHIRRMRIGGRHKVISAVGS